MYSFKIFQAVYVLFFSVLCSLLSQSCKPFLVQFSSSYYTIDKSYMFLLCNIILAFIALYSSLINPSSSTTHQNIEHVHDSEKSNRFEFYIPESEITEPIYDDNVMENEYQEEENSLMIVEPEKVVIEVEEDEEKEEGNALMESESQIEENEEVKSLVIVEVEVEQESVNIEAEEEVEEEGNDLRIIDEDETEELNKKCEDFIKKMKATFCSDS
ncbi:hypothetical protein MtrunA17_Chr5g0448311 [Medicago truncatula]|uniref:Transmembrane protein, putative n=1 Tax=Medicago truncatula TaxID=3880 RepID=G7K0N9_MEDTR|nr:uncharacterized protein LOC11419654 [Medicago truncatula]AET01024.1 transmembrane protein, putative [Medicago truncatula]RHN58178.1 hypothetical protein MtrunA17_Chr5g0448311 [Medicago truncatula]